MKTLKRLLFLFAGISLLVACNDPLDWKLTPIVCNGPVFTVKPNGVDDTPNLQTAFNKAITAGPGSVVKLVRGEYKLGFIEVREFKGSFVGAGKGKTIITAMTGLDCDALSGNPYLIKFIGGDIFMSDMTLQAPVISCISGAGLTGLLMFTDYSVVVPTTPVYVHAVVNNVDFIGQKVGTTFTSINALGAFPDSKAVSGLIRSHVDITIANCIIDAFKYGFVISDINEGVLRLGTRNNGNIFSNCNNAAQFYDDTSVSFK